MNKETGGPAFAASGHPGQQFVQQEGMTLRDYFAAKAMQGDWALQGDKVGSDIDNELLKSRADIYYRMADAMLATRSQ